MLWRKKLRISFFVFLFVLLGTFFIYQFVADASSGFLYSDIQKIPQKQVALVLGAKVKSSGAMSDILKDRVATALDLYRAKKVSKILVSGDHGEEEYDEVNAMKDFLLKEKVRPEDLFLDHAGFDTYDSVYRAREIFQVDSLIVVTQEFHLVRAVYIARSLGIDAVGMAADRQKYLGMARNELREIPARVKAFLDVAFGSKPKFLGEKIPITGESGKSWD